MSVEIKSIVDEIKSLWLDCLQNSPDVFRYKLNIEHEKILDGKFKFLVQVIKNAKINFSEWHRVHKYF